MTPTQPDGYLATPTGDHKGAVLVLHPWWGLNDTIRHLCDRLAAEGYLAFAPDLYHGRVAATIPDAESLMQTLDGEQATADVATAADFLHQYAGQPPRGLAVMGFSMGAYHAIALSEADPDRVGKGVLFYGTGPSDLRRTRAAYLGHFAANDAYEEQEYIDMMADGMRQAGATVTFYTYPDTEHWFFEPDRPEYAPAAAALAWERTLAFLEG